MGWTIRNARPLDLDELLSIVEEHARFERAVATISRAQLQSALGTPCPPVDIIVAAGPRGLLGYAALTFDFSLWRGSEWCHLDCLFVRAEVRGCRIGEALFRSVRQKARERGADQLEWQTPSWNHRAAAFYRRQGAGARSKLRFSLELHPKGTELETPLPFT